MQEQTSSTASITHEPRQLTVWYLLRFSLPLSLTFIMMSGSAPLVSTGIAWMHGAAGERVHLTAFLVSFVTALFLYSPMFTARNVAIRVIRDRRSLAAFCRFYLGSATLSAGLLILVSQLDPLGHLIFGRWLGTSAETEQLARQGLLAFTPIPILVALRGLGQGCHITNQQTWIVGAGTVLRFACMAGFIFGYAIHHAMSGPVLGGCTYLIGIGAETLFVLVLLIGKPQWTERHAAPVMGLGDYIRYAGPLMLASVVHQAVGPILVRIIHEARLPGENGAAFDLVRDTAWLLVSMIMCIQAVVIAHATSPANLRIILRYSAAIVTGTTTVAASLAWSPLGELLFVRALRVDNAVILELLYLSLVWLLPMPAISWFNHFVMSLHTRSGRTRWPMVGNLAGMAVLLALAFSLDLSAMDGAVLAVVGNGLFQCVSAGVQCWGLRHGGLAAALCNAPLNGRPRSPKPPIATASPQIGNVSMQFRSNPPDSG